MLQDLLGLLAQIRIQAAIEPLAKLVFLVLQFLICKTKLHLKMGTNLTKRVNMDTLKTKTARSNWPLHKI